MKCNELLCYLLLLFYLLTAVVFCREFYDVFSRLLEVRSRLYELMTHCIPADVIMRVTLTVTASCNQSTHPVFIFNIIKPPLAIARAAWCIGAVHLFVSSFICPSVAKMQKTRFSQKVSNLEL